MAALLAGMLVLGDELPHREEATCGRGLCNPGLVPPQQPRCPIPEPAGFPRIPVPARHGPCWALPKFLTHGIREHKKTVFSPCMFSGHLLNISSNCNSQVCLLSPFCRGTERVSHLPKVTQLVMAGPKCEPRLPEPG